VSNQGTRIGIFAHWAAAGSGAVQDINTAANTVRLYFCELDLTIPGNQSRKERTEDRLHRAITQLVTRVPASTYTQK